MRAVAHRAGALAAASLMLMAAAATAAEIKVMSSGGLTAAYLELAP